VINFENGLVDVKDLKAHPLNEKLYPFKEHKNTIDLLSKKLYTEYKATGIPNHTPLDVCPETGTVNSGHFRWYSSQDMKDEKGNKVEITKLKAVPGRVFNPDYVEYDEMKFLEKFNKDGKRDEYEITTLVHNYNQQNKAFEKKYGREFNNKERNQFATDSRFDKTKFKNIIFLNANHPSIYKQFIDGKITLPKAMRLSGKVKPTKKYNPDRHNFFDTLNKYPKIGLVMTTKGKQLINEFRNLGNGIIFDDDMGWETNQITSPLSNIWMSAAVYAFNSVKQPDLKCVTPRKRQGYADIHFENLTKKFSEDYLSERIEVKVGAWQGNASSTVVYGGMGSVNVTPHEYIIGIHNDELKKHFLMITTLDKDDWKTDGKDSNATMSLSSWFRRYYDQKDKYRILLGDIFKGNKSVEVQWG
tara:strand:+ start:997 stop:2241 length:1245 start_codon:yes stop_codon:yes gene_type:complete